MGNSQSQRPPRGGNKVNDTPTAAGGGSGPQAVPQAAANVAQPAATVPQAAANVPQAAANDVPLTPAELNYSVANLERLVELGFKEEDAKTALGAHDDNINEAAQALVNQGNCWRRDSDGKFDINEFIDLNSFGIRFRSSLFDRFIHAAQAVVLLDAVNINQHAQNNKYYTLFLLVLALMNGHSAITNATSRDKFKWMTVFTLIAGFFFFSGVVADQFFGLAANAFYFPCRFSTQRVALPVLMWQVNALTLISRRYSLRVLRQRLLSGGSWSEKKGGWNLALGPPLVRICVYLIANTALLGAISERQVTKADPFGAVVAVIFVGIYLLHTCFIILPPKLAPLVMNTSLFVATFTLLCQMEILPSQLVVGWPMPFVFTLIYLLMTLLGLRYLHEFFPATLEKPKAQ